MKISLSKDLLYVRLDQNSKHPYKATNIQSPTQNFIIIQLCNNITYPSKYHYNHAPRVWMNVHKIKHVASILVSLGFAQCFINTLAVVLMLYFTYIQYSQQYFNKYMQFESLFGKKQLAFVVCDFTCTTNKIQHHQHHTLYAISIVHGSLT